LHSGCSCRSQSAWLRDTEGLGYLLSGTNLDGDCGLMYVAKITNARCAAVLHLSLTVPQQIVCKGCPPYSERREADARLPTRKLWMATLCDCEASAQAFALRLRLCGPL
ncbi:hypothetical protein WUBG_09876, partial [Wuchereria bancrofti]